MNVVEKETQDVTAPPDSTASLRAITAGIGDAVVIADERGLITSWNPAAARIFGYPEEAVLGRPLTLLMPERYRALHEQGVARVRETGRTRITGQTLEILGLRRDGSEFPIELSLSTWVEGGERRFCAFIRDISERQQAELELLREREALEAIARGTALATGEGFFRSLVRHLAAVFGVRYAFVSEIIDGRGGRARCLAAWTGEGYGECGDCDLRDTPCGAAPPGSISFYPDGLRSRFPRDARLATLQAESYLGMPLLDSHGNRIGQLCVLDTRPMRGDTRLQSILQIFAARAGAELERMRAEEALRRSEVQLRKDKEEQERLNQRLREAQTQLLQSEKMATIGQLAAGIAHEINNPIGYVSSNLTTLEKYLGNLFELVNLYEVCEPILQTHPEFVRLAGQVKERVELGYLREDIGAIVRESREGIERVRKIVQDLKGFSHVGEQKWAPADLHRELDSTLNIVRNEIKYKAEVVRDYGDLPPVECVASQLNQVFMNLLVNAAQAIEEHGTITLATGRDGEDWVWVRVSDTGRGIEPAHLARVFDPFFTTKPVGRGTGLGLSVSYGIVQRHGGRIEVESEPGAGTCFTVRLPVRRPAAAEAQEETADG